MTLEKLNVITPRKIAIITSILSIAVAILAYIPLSRIFAGQWIVKQQLELFELNSISLFGSTISGPGLLTLRYYALMIFLGMMAGYFLSIFLSKWHFVATTVIDRLFIGLLIFGLIGARFVYVVFNWSSFEVEPASVLYVFQGGLSFFGMLYFGLLYLWVYCSRFKFNIWEFLDIIAPGVLIGQVIGRWGNFFNYEAFGGPTKVAWKMFVPSTSRNIYSEITQQFFHPTFLYEIIPNIILFVAIMFYYENLTNKRAGQVFAVYAIGYGFIRYITEFFRLDALKFVVPSELGDTLNLPFDTIAISQILALLTVCFGMFVIWKRSKIIYLKKTMSEYSIS